NADGLGPNAAYIEGIRETLRRRGRYETTNNSYLKSLVRSVAYDLVGTGPRPQLAFPTAKVSAEDTRKVEMRYAKWARRNKLARKYRTMHKALTRCGAGLLLFDNNDLSKDRVKFTVRGVEVDQLRTPPQYAGDLNVIDGIRLDSSGNPIEYYFLRNHPGENALFFGLSPNHYVTVPADKVVHWYVEDRPGQQHGIPEITPALPLMAKLRRYSDATLTAAEFASMVMGILKTTLPPGEGVKTIDDWTFFEAVRGALLSAPAGWEPDPMKAEQPTTTFPEIGRGTLTKTGQ